MSKRARGEKEETTRHDPKRKRRQGNRTIKEERPSRLTHTSRHTTSDHDRERSAFEDVQIWTYQGGASQEKHVGKSFHHVFGQASEHDTNEAQRP